jgi:hypothetical protein
MTVKTVTLIDPEVALLVMDCIMFDQAKERCDTFAAYAKLDEVNARMATMSAPDLSAAQYEYEKATGQL